MTNILGDVGLASNVTTLQIMVENARVDRASQFQTDCMAFASITILLWDHIVSFSDEVEYVWRGRNGPFKYLFLLNRYLTPLGFSINIIAYMSSWLTPEICPHFVRFEGSMTVTGINVVAIMMFYRVYALYKKSLHSRALPTPLYFLLFIFCAELATNAWLLTKGIAVQHFPGGSTGCEMIFDASVSRTAASASAWLPLLYDAVAFGLVLWETFPERGAPLTSLGVSYHRRLLQDGIIYFCPIMLVTLILSLMIAFAPPGLQNITAQLELIITVTMMSRITINLKKTGRRKHDIDTTLATMPSPAGVIVSHAQAQLSTVVNFTKTMVQDDDIRGDIELTPRTDISSLTLQFDADKSFASPKAKDLAPV